MNDLERLKTENLAMQARIDELEAENAKLHRMATGHLDGKTSALELYHNLVEQLYPYAMGLRDYECPPTDVLPPEFLSGYNRACECIAENLLEMMQPNEEYIRMICEMV